LGSDLQSKFEAVKAPLPGRRLSLSSAYDLGSTANLRTHFCLVLLLTFGALAIDYLLAPSLYNGSTLWATGALFVLTLRGKEEGDSRGSNEAFALGRAWRFLLFALLHLALVPAGLALASVLQTASLSYTLSSGAMALAKFIVLLPTVVLLPLGLWRRVIRAFRPEVLAFLVVLLTFFPRRIFATLWPWYSQLLGRTVLGVAGLFVPNLFYKGAPIPTFVGPELDISIIFACSGIEGVSLFDSLFALVVAVEWKWLNKGRALIAYLVGFATVLTANALRISLLVILGNRGFADWVRRQHVEAGWVFFVVTFLAFLSVAYNWMLQAKTFSSSDASIGKQAPPFISP
jgi:exosortase/archaeosortase family protein